MASKSNNPVTQEINPIESAKKSTSQDKLTPDKSAKQSTPQDKAVSGKPAKQSPPPASLDGITEIANKGTESLTSTMECYKDIDLKALEVLKEIGANTEDPELKREIVEEIKQIHNDAYTKQTEEAERVAEKEKTSYDYKVLYWLLFLYVMQKPEALSNLFSFRPNSSFSQLKELPGILKSALRFKR